MASENLTLADIAATTNKLTAILGPTLLAFACNVRRLVTLHHWADGTAQPDDDELERLKMVDEVVATVSDSDGSAVARSWFIGMSCGEDRSMSPAEAIRVCNFDDARASAQRMTEDAWE